MSYRSSDAYSRRPTGDDRRISDSRDRRRESLHKAGSDPHREDRHRRDADISNRGSRRDPPEEHFRETPLLNNAAKQHLASSSRSENGIQARRFCSPQIYVLLILPATHCRYQANSRHQRRPYRHLQKVLASASASTKKLTACSDNMTPPS